MKADLIFDSDRENPQLLLEAEVDHVALGFPLAKGIRPQIRLVYPPPEAEAVSAIAKAMAQTGQLPRAYSWPGHIGVMFRMMSVPQDVLAKLVQAHWLEVLAEAGTLQKVELLTAGEQDFAEEPIETFIESLQKGDGSVDVFILKGDKRASSVLWTTTLLEVEVGIPETIFASI